MTRHDDEVRDQFTRQARVFAEAPAIADQAALDLLVRISGAGAGDSVLDVACGPGLVVCAFAHTAGRATGIDITPAMIERARELQREEGLHNAAWSVGSVEALPFRDVRFSIVCSRFAFHHFQAPGRVLAEMKRVCRPEGRIVVADVVASEDRETAERFNAMDKLRDPSHVRFMPLSELRALIDEAGLARVREERYGLAGELEALLARSFPAPGGAEAVRRIIEESLPSDALGLGAHLSDGAIRFIYPVAAIVASLPA